MKLKITFFFIAFISTLTIAQTKTGTLDSDFIIGLMPETKTVIKMAQVYGSKLDSSFTIKMKDYQTKVEEFRSKEKEMGELMKKTLINELKTLEKEIQQYQNNGQQLMKLKQDELMRPLYKKLNNAVQEIVKEKGYTHILTISGNKFAYVDQKYDITEAVMKKLGIEIPKPQEDNN